jgi:GNAT superfamily N-acetyltransferase
MSGKRPVIRRATPADVPALGKFGGNLMRAHYEFDSQRFMSPGDNPGEGYAAFLGSQLDDADVAVFVAERDGQVLGYLYASIEPQSWKELREEAGFIHDIFVDELGRRMGLATELVEAALDWFRERRMPRVLLWTAEPNVDARRLFTDLGFRRTMVEMTKEI